MNLALRATGPPRRAKARPTTDRGVVLGQAVAARTIRLGLDRLGIAVVEKM